MAIRQNNITAPTDGAMITGGINSLNLSGIATNQTIKHKSNVSSQAYSNSNTTNTSFTVNSH